MPFLININILKTNGVTQNANIDVGGIVHNSHTANSKFVGTISSLGDISPALALVNNNVLDSDISDQGQLGTVSTPVTGQF